MGIELVPEASPTERAAVGRALATAALDAAEASPPWWRAGLDEALDHAPAGLPRSSVYEAVRSPRRTRGATRA